MPEHKSDLVTILSLLRMKERSLEAQLAKLSAERESLVEQMKDLNRQIDDMSTFAGQRAGFELAMASKRTMAIILRRRMITSEIQGCELRLADRRQAFARVLHAVRQIESDLETTRRSRPA